MTTKRRLMKREDDVDSVTKEVDKEKCKQEEKFDGKKKPYHYYEE
jgi:hypothetical protein